MTVSGTFLSPPPIFQVVMVLDEALHKKEHWAKMMKNLYLRVLFVFQRFIMILSEHLVRCDTDGIDFKTPWYNWTVGRLQQIFLMVSS